jgi:dihydrofolate reductase
MVKRMRNVIVSLFVSLDGVMEDPGGAEKSEYGGWTWPYHNDEIGKFKFEELFASDALVLGRVTYEGFAAAWPSRTDEAGFAQRMNSIPKYVASTTLKEAGWNNSTLINADVEGEVSRLKQQPGQDILIFGSGAVIRTLMKHDLVDEYRFLIYPIVVGIGKRVFGPENHRALKLLETRSFKTGVVLVRYKPDR